MSARDPFSRIARLRAAALASGEELFIWSFVAHAEAPESMPERLERSFRYELADGAWIQLRAEAPRRSLWRQRTEEHLKRAGYQMSLSGDRDIDARRWLARTSEQEPELAFLHALGPRARPANWPSRRPRDAACPVARPQYLAAMERVRNSSFRPTECWLSGSLRNAVQTSGLWIAAAIHEAGSYALLTVDITDDQDRTRPLPAPLRRKLQRVLQDEGYEQSRWRSPDQSTTGSRKVASPERVITETQRITAAMAKHIEAVLRP